MHDKYVSGGFSLIGPAHTRYEKFSPDKLLEVCREKITVFKDNRIIRATFLDGSIRIQNLQGGIIG